MEKYLVDILKKIPLATTTVRYIRGNFIQSRTGKSNATVFSYKMNLIENEQLQVTKLSKENSLYIDRLNELRGFYNVSYLRLFFHYLLNGTPNTNYYRYRLNSYFTKMGTEEEILKKTYESVAFMYANRLMLRYHNYDIGLRILEIARDLSSLKANELRVLDYGCGVADPSLILALHGANVMIVDLEDSKFNFAKSRFRNRNLVFSSKGAEQTELPVETEGKYNFIILAEVLEHVRNPRLFLEYAVQHLKEEGVLYDSLGPFYGHTVGGSHLQEAKEQIESTDYSDFHAANLVPVNAYLKDSRYERFYIKR